MDMFPLPSLSKYTLLYIRDESVEKTLGHFACIYYVFYIMHSLFKTGREHSEQKLSTFNLVNISSITLAYLNKETTYKQVQYCDVTFPMYGK